jgi:hypothetical protein
MTDPCLHENWWGELKSDVKTIKEDVAGIKYQLNGKDGVVTKTEVQGASLKRVWWWLGSVSVAILGIAGWVIKSR